MRRRQSRPVRGDLRGSGCSRVNAAATAAAARRSAGVGKLTFGGDVKLKCTLNSGTISVCCFLFFILMHLILRWLFFYTLAYKLNKFTLHQFAKHTSPPPPQQSPTTCAAALCHISLYAAVSLQLRLPLAAWCAYISNKSGALPLYHSEVTSWGWLRSPSPSLPDSESSLLL